MHYNKQDLFSPPHCGVHGIL